MNRFIAVKSTFRHYGYSVQDTKQNTEWFLGSRCTARWYKYKYDAEKAAQVYEESSQNEPWRYELKAEGNV